MGRHHHFRFNKSGFHRSPAGDGITFPVAATATALAAALLFAKVDFPMNINVLRPFLEQLRAGRQRLAYMAQVTKEAQGEGDDKKPEEEAAATAEKANQNEEKKKEDEGDVATTTTKNAGGGKCCFCCGHVKANEVCARALTKLRWAINEARGHLFGSKTQKSLLARAVDLPLPPQAPLAISTQHIVDVLAGRYTSVFRARCTVFDVDYALHMNNGKYASYCDRGRGDLTNTSGINLAALRQGAYLVVANISLQYRVSIMLHHEFEVHTTVVGYDSNSIYFQQLFVSVEKKGGKGGEANKKKNKDEDGKDKNKDTTTADETNNNNNNNNTKQPHQPKLYAVVMTRMAIQSKKTLKDVLTPLGVFIGSVEEAERTPIASTSSTAAAAAASAADRAADSHFVIVEADEQGDKKSSSKNNKTEGGGGGAGSPTATPPPSLTAISSADDNNSSSDSASLSSLSAAQHANVPLPPSVATVTAGGVLGVIPPSRAPPTPHTNARMAVDAAKESAKKAHALK